MDMRHCYGTFTKDGATISSFGLTCTRTGTGMYELTFDQAYSAAPAVVGTQIYPNQTDSDGGNTRDNVVCVYVRKDKCKVKTGDSGGSSSDRDFSVIVLGT